MTTSTRSASSGSTTISQARRRCRAVTIHLAFLYVGPEARCVLEHLSEVEFGELSIDHALEDVRDELELPIPPGRPPHPGRVLSQLGARGRFAKPQRCSLAPRAEGRRAMERILEACAGLDVHQATVVATVRCPAPGGKRREARERIQSVIGSDPGGLSGGGRPRWAGSLDAGSGSCLLAAEPF